jgi:hypothetical protein
MSYLGLVVRRLRRLIEVSREWNVRTIQGILLATLTLWNKITLPILLEIKLPWKSVLHPLPIRIQLLLMIERLIIVVGVSRLALVLVLRGIGSLRLCPIALNWDNK